MRLAVLFGGISYEHEISIVSAITLKKSLKEREPLFIFLDFERDFYLIPEDKMVSKTFSSGEYKEFKKLSPKLHGFEHKSFLKKEFFENLRVLNLIHGASGEDSTIYSMLDFYQIEAISPRREASILSFNKYLTKMYAHSVGVKTLEHQVIGTRDDREITVPYPFVVKPLTLGSSLGVRVVRKEEELDYALDTAFEYDNHALIEPFIEGVEEYNIAGTYTTHLVLSNIEKPEKREILDFESKYMDFSRSEVVPNATVSLELKEKLISAFQKIYTELFHGAIIRCDFFVIDDEVYLNEINSIPGSMANYLFPDFVHVLDNIHIPEKNIIPESYQYINHIQKAKG
jgi:D-alanine-D-alanine ligase